MGNNNKNYLLYDHCRIGSLESRPVNELIILNDHCRIGSLETGMPFCLMTQAGSLPHRQLRNR